MREVTPKGARITHQLKALDDVAQNGGQTALVVHRVRLAPGEHNPDQAPVLSTMSAPRACTRMIRSLGIPLTKPA